MVILFSKKFVPLHTNIDIRGGAINYHRKVLFMLDGLRFVILRSFY